MKIEYLLFIVLAVIVLVLIGNYLGRRKWLQEVNLQRGKWPNQIIDYLMAHPRCRPIDKVKSIMGYQAEWSTEFLLAILNKKLSIGMTTPMVIESWGRPNDIQEKEITAKGKKVRWVYGVPRKGAQYIWFTNDVLTKIQS